MRTRPEDFIIEEIGRTYDLEESYLLEIKFIKELNALHPNGFNMSEGGYSNIGLYVRDSTKEKLRVHNLGKKYSEETKEKRRIARDGYRHSNETKNKISRSHKGKEVKQETRDKISNTLLGKHPGELNPFHGKKHTEETKKKIKDYWDKYRRGEIPKIVRSEEAKKNISSGRLKRFQKRPGYEMGV